MQVKEVVSKLSNLDPETDICVYWQNKPKDIDIFTWSWICDNFDLKTLRKFNSEFVESIYILQKRCPFVPKVASGDVVLVERTQIAQK